MNDIVKIREPQAGSSLLMDPDGFEHAQRAGRMMAMSALFPAHLRAGAPEAAMANAVLIMNIAQRMGEDPLAVAQNIYIVQNKPGWSASYMISRANQSGVFKGPVRWRSEGVGDKLKVTAYAALTAFEDETVEAEASMAMAKAEGWTKNPKYQSMPEQMLRYRSATLLIRLYCPEVMLGMHSVDEIEDMRAAEAKDITPQPKPQPMPAQAPKSKEAEIIPPQKKEPKEPTQPPPAQSASEQDVEELEELEAQVKAFSEAMDSVSTLEDFNQIMNEEAEWLDRLEADFPDLYAKADAAIKAAKERGLK